MIKCINAGFKGAKRGERIDTGEGKNSSGMSINAGEKGGKDSHTIKLHSGADVWNKKMLNFGLPSKQNSLSVLLYFVLILVNAIFSKKSIYILNGRNMMAKLQLSN